MSLLDKLEISLLAVCLWGLTALLITGQFNSAIIVFCMFALVVGYYYRRKGWQPTPLLGNIAAACVFLACAAVLVTTFNLLTATVYLFVLLQLTKYVTRQNLTEIRWCYLISLFHVIGASVITTTIAFGFMLVVYIFLILISLRLYVMARASEFARTLTTNSDDADQAPASSSASNPPIKPHDNYSTRRILWSSTGLLIVVMLVSSALFSAIPRLATQNLFQQYGKAPQEPSLSAFSEDVEFGSLESIQLDDGVALFVEPKTKNRPAHVRMRGVALDTFDGKSWKRTSQVFSQNGKYEFRPSFTTNRPTTTTTFRVLQPPGVTNFLFGDSFPESIQVPRPFQFMADSLAQTVYLPEMPPKEFQYEVESAHEEMNQRVDPAIGGSKPTPMNALLYQTGRSRSRSSGDLSLDDFEQLARQFSRDLVTSPSSGKAESSNSEAENKEPPSPHKRDPRNYSQSVEHLLWLRNQAQNGKPLNDQQRMHYYLWKCIQLPEMLSTGRVPQLAKQWTTDSATTFAKAMTIEHHLRTDYRYSLTPTAKGNFIEDFLFNVKEGHCEYFATSMAVLLRNLGIPSRVVNGYYSTEWNSISGNFTVRHRDAHSWVEAWLGDNYGWMTFDPTPPGGVARRGDHNAFLAKLSSITDALRVRWYRYVVDYSISDQVSAFKKVMEWRQKLMDRLGKASIMGFRTADLKSLEFTDFTREFDFRPIALVIIALLIIALWQSRRIIRWRTKRQLTSVTYYDELLKLLARRGLKPAAGQTPREFAQYVASFNLRWTDFIHVTELYYLVRYRGSTLTKDDHGKIRDLKSAIANSDTAGNHNKIPAT